MQGGFIWDLIDQGLVLGKQSGCFGYGGDFNDFPNTAQFCINGILGPDRSPHPIAYEAAALQSPVELELKVQISSKNSYRVYLVIQNRRSFLDLSDLKIFLSLGTNLSPIAEMIDYTIPMNLLPSVPPLSSVEYDLSFCFEELISECLKRPLIIPRSDNDLFLSLTEIWINSSIRTTKATEGVPTDHQIASKSHFHPLLLSAVQSYLPEEAKTFTFEKAPVMKMEIKSFDQILKVEWANGNCVTFGRDCGRLLSWSIQGHDLLTTPIELCLWRAPTDNDRSGSNMVFVHFF